MRPQAFYEDMDSAEPLLAPQRGVSVRLMLFYGLIAIVFGIFAMRIIHLQMVRGDELSTMADENRFRTVRTNAARGIIYDRTGLPLVRNVPSYNVTIIPAYVPDEDEEALAMYKRLSAMIEVPVTTTITMEPSPDSKLLFQRPGLHDLSEPSPTYLVPVENKGIRELVELASTFEPYEPTLIKADIDRELAQQIEELGPWLPGVEIEVVPVREYPTGEMTSHLVGYMGPLPSDDYLDYGYEKTDRVGYSGVEVVLEAELSGTKGEKEVEVDVAGKQIRAVGPTIDPIPGLNAYLTIDTRLQIAGTHALTRTINAVNQLWDIKLEQGVVIAMDPRSGEILAMVSIPSYDNNRFSTKIDLEYYQSLLEDIYNPLVNHAISGQYPPGSTFKLVTASGALEDGVITPNTRIVGEGIVYLENKYAPNDPGQAQPFYCWYREGHGALNVVGALAQSCNIFFYKVGGGFPPQKLEGLGDQRLAWYAEQYGFGALSGIELVGEAPGHVPTARWKRLTYGESWSTGDTYNMATGQGFVTATPLQVLNMGATVANGGTLYRPQLIHHLTDATGNVVRVGPDGTTSLLTDADGNPIPPPRNEDEMDLVFEPEVIRWLEVSPQNLALVQEGMRRAVTEGTAKAVSLDDYGIHVAAKTGTAEFCDNLAIRRGWCREGWPLPTHAWTVAYAPYEDPEIAVVAFVYNGGEGSAVAVPIVRQFLEAYYQVGRYTPPEASQGGPS
jgi:penicillin-binding protein 2